LGLICGFENVAKQLRIAHYANRVNNAGRKPRHTRPVFQRELSDCEEKRWFVGHFVLIRPSGYEGLGLGGEELAGDLVFLYAKTKKPIVELNSFLEIHVSPDLSIVDDRQRAAL
jgi:hypothetical protein